MLSLQFKGPKLDPSAKYNLAANQLKIPNRGSVAYKRASKKFALARSK